MYAAELCEQIRKFAPTRKTEKFMYRIIKTHETEDFRFLEFLVLCIQNRFPETSLKPLA